MSSDKLLKERLTFTRRQQRTASVDVPALWRRCFRSFAGRCLISCWKVKGLSCRERGSIVEFVIRVAGSRGRKERRVLLVTCISRHLLCSREKKPVFSLARLASNRQRGAKRMFASFR